MWKLILIFCAGALAVDAAMASISDNPVKATFTTDRPAEDVASCVAEKLSYLAAPAMVPSSEGNVRIRFSAWGRDWAEVTIKEATPTSVLLRGTSGAKVKRRIGECL